MNTEIHLRSMQRKYSAFQSPTWPLRPIEHIFEIEGLRYYSKVCNLSGFPTGETKTQHPSPQSKVRNYENSNISSIAMDSRNVFRVKQFLIKFPERIEMSISAIKLSQEWSNRHNFWDPSRGSTRIPYSPQFWGHRLILLQHLARVDSKYVFPTTV